MNRSYFPWLFKTTNLLAFAENTSYKCIDPYPTTFYYILVCILYIQNEREYHILEKCKLFLRILMKLSIENVIKGALISRLSKST